jgi:hypothetical protein
VLAQQAGLLTTSAKVLDAERFLCNQREAERCAQNLPAAFAQRSIDRDMVETADFGSFGRYQETPVGEMSRI